MDMLMEAQTLQWRRGNICIWLSTLGESSVTFSSLLFWFLSAVIYISDMAVAMLWSTRNSPGD